MATHSSILAYKNPHGQKSLVSYSLWGCKESDTQLSKHSSTVLLDHLISLFFVFFFFLNMIFF